MEIIPDDREYTEEVRVLLSKAELQTLILSARAVLTGIEDWEFDTMVGGTKENLRATLAELERLGSSFIENEGEADKQ